MKMDLLINRLLKTSPLSPRLRFLLLAFSVLSLSQPAFALKAGYKVYASPGKGRFSNTSYDHYIPTKEQKIIEKDGESLVYSKVKFRNAGKWDYAWVDYRALTKSEKKKYPMMSQKPKKTAPMTKIKDSSTKKFNQNFRYSTRPPALNIGSDLFIGTRDFLTNDDNKKSGEVKKSQNKKMKAGYSYVQLNDLRMNVRGKRGNDIGKGQFVLSGDSLLQIPTSVVVRDSKNRMSLSETLKNWIERSKVDPSIGKPIYSKSKKQWFFPTQVIQSGNSKAKNKKGYVSLDYIRDNHPNSLKMIQSEKELTEISDAHFGSDNSSCGNGGSSESTCSKKNKTEKKASAIRVFDCKTTKWYVKSKAHKHNCWKGLSTEAKAKKIMANVRHINKRRPHFKPDPRFSVCISQKESKLIPNQGNPYNSRGRRLSSAIGMFQILFPTQKDARQRAGKTVIDGYGHLSMKQYRSTMKKSSLLQTDLHHRVLYLKAKSAGLMTAINKGSSSAYVYQRLARYYYDANRGGPYSYAVTKCYKCIKKIFNRKGQRISKNNLKNCLERVH